MKHLFGIMMLAGLLVSCSNDSDPTIETEQEGSERSMAYMAVSIRSGESATSRADFEKDTEQESKIKNIAFYFFDKEGAPVSVNDHSTNVYVYSKESDIQPSQKIETGQPTNRITDAIVVLRNLNGHYPYSMLTVVNPYEPTKMANKTKDEMLSSVDSYSYANMNDRKYFTMTNSVYFESDSIVNVTNIDGMTYKTKDLAEASPMQVYVERTLAKFVVTGQNVYDNLETDNTIPASNIGEDGSEITIKAKIIGWTVTGGLYKKTATAGVSTEDDAALLVGAIPNSFLVKKISKDWSSSSSDPFVGTSAPSNTLWNSNDYKRSFWAISPESPDLEFKHQYSAKSFGQEIGDTHPQYFVENTLQKKSTDNGLLNRPKLIVRVKFMNGTDSIVPAKWAGKMYTLKGLQNAIALSLKSQLKLEKVSTPPTTTEKTIEAYISFTQNEKNKPYISSAVFDFEKFNNRTAPDNDFHLKFLDGDNWVEYNNSSEDHKSKIEAIMKNVVPAYIWSYGGYYYMGVKHLGEAGSIGEYGIVRNHVYKYDIKSIKGLGTPICNPDIIIDPVRPSDDESFIAAQLNVLSWRIVKHEDVNLE